MSWREALAEQLDALGPFARGRLIVEPGEADEVIPAERFLDPDFLRSAIRDAGRPKLPVSGQTRSADAEEPDVRAAASRLTRQYAPAVSTVALTALGAGVGVDVSTARCSVVVDAKTKVRLVVDLDESQLVGCAERPTDWVDVGGPVVATVAELRAWVWRKLYGEHLLPLLTRTLEVAAVSPALLWSNGSETPSELIDAAMWRLDPAAAEPFVDDGRAVLEAESLPGVEGPNPLRDTMVWEPFEDADFPAGVLTRRMCCINYLLERRSGYLCGNCPYLAVEDRVALRRELRVRGEGLGSAAARRAMEVGMAKLARHTTPRVDIASER